eukprot:15117-Heterococcus_DN1.PRE.3
MHTQINDSNPKHHAFTATDQSARTSTDQSTNAASGSMTPCCIKTASYVPTVFDKLKTKHHSTSASRWCDMKRKGDTPALLYEVIDGFWAQAAPETAFETFEPLAAVGMELA